MSCATSRAFRSKILLTVRELFYRDGIRAAGLDTIVAKSAVAKCRANTSGLCAATEVADPDLLAEPAGAGDSGRGGGLHLRAERR